jgi:serine/threonine protein kinase
MLFHPRYIVQGLIGRGGACCVHTAWDKVLKRTVAVKVPHLHTPYALTQFEQEKTLMAQCHHPALMPIWDASENHTPTPWFVMPYLQGSTLHTHVHKKGLLKPEQACLWMSHILCALDALHASGVVHCDVTPHNIFITSQGQAVLFDLGSACAQNQPQNMLCGTPGFMAPEYAEKGIVGPFTDIYSVGKVFQHTTDLTNTPMLQHWMLACTHPQKSARTASAQEALIHLQEACTPRLEHTPTKPFVPYKHLNIQRGFQSQPAAF